MAEASARSAGGSTDSPAAAAAVLPAPSDSFESIDGRQR